MVRPEGTGDVEAQGQLEGLADQYLLGHDTGTGIHDLPPRGVPRTAIGATVDAQVHLLRDEHRPLVDVDATAGEPFPELLRLGKEVVLDQRAFEPWKGREEALTESDILQQMAVREEAGVYVLGCFERRITLYTQQVRALNLVHSLFAEERLKADSKLAVIGGGAAGLTAAGTAIRGARVTVFEQASDLLPSAPKGNGPALARPFRASGGEDRAQFMLTSSGSDCR